MSTMRYDSLEADSLSERQDNEWLNRAEECGECGRLFAFEEMQEGYGVLLCGACYAKREEGE